MLDIKRIQTVLDDVKKGNLIIIIDDINREHEGDLFVAGELVSVEAINAMIRKAGGLICVPISKQIGDNLGLVPMVENPTDKLYTPFTNSIDFVDAKTGISAFERTETIAKIADKNSTKATFTTPGHIFPLIAHEGGVVSRQGHTEAAVELCKLCGLNEAGVICEIIKEDGHMARTEDLKHLSQL